MNAAMGRRPVVTLWETYGSGAGTVGPAVADALGVPYIGQHFSSEQLEEAHGQTGLADNLLTRVLATLGRTAASTDAALYSSTLARDVAEDVRELRAAVADGGVVLGRNATVILADLPGALHVKLDGPLEQRIQRGADAAGIDVARARARQAREDAVRAELSLRRHNWDPRTNDRFDLVVNTGQLPLDLAVQVILAAQRLKAAR